MGPCPWSGGKASACSDLLLEGAGPAGTPPNKDLPHQQKKTALGWHVCGRGNVSGLGGKLEPICGRMEERPV